MPELDLWVVLLCALQYDHDLGDRKRAKLLDQLEQAIAFLLDDDLAEERPEALAKVAGLSTTTIFGGVGQGPQVNALRQGVDIVIACPGRLQDLVQGGHAHLDDIEITVLDEADHLCDLGFFKPIDALLARTPANSQRLLLSATLDGDVDKLVRRHLPQHARFVDPRNGVVYERDGRSLHGVLLSCDPCEQPFRSGPFTLFAIVALPAVERPSVLRSASESASVFGGVTLSGSTRTIR